jgi:hypothetical protein
MTMTCNWLRIARYVLAAGAVSTLTACGLAGVAASRTTGNSVGAQYVPNKTDTMLILVESYGLSLDSGIETEHMTLVLRKTFEDGKIASLVDPQALERLKDAGPQQYTPMTIADIGRRVGARQVLYVNIWRSEIVKPTGSGQMRGHMNAVVKIVDSASGDTRWPSDAPSEAVEITTDWTPEKADKTEDDLRAQMADQMAADIGKLFQNYHPDQAPMEKVNVDSASNF